MKRITNISELKQGDQIVSVNCEGHCFFRRFVCPHPYNSEYSLVFDATVHPERFENRRLETEEWYLFDDSDESWLEVHEKSYALRKAELERFESRIKGLRNKIAAKNESNGN